MSEPIDTTTDWPLQATETIVGFVDDVKHKTTKPATKAARAIVYGIVIVLLGVPILIMLLVGVVHFLNKALITLFDNAFDVEVDIWLTYVVLGVIFSIAGWFLWRKRVV
jgi:hypothetical protein